MGTIVSSVYLTLDGDITNMQDWHFDYIDEEAQAAAADLLFGSEALLMGRATYEGFAPAWMSRAGADPFSGRMNEIPKYVVSTTLTEPQWPNTTVVSENVAEEIAALKARTNGRLLQYGFGDVSRLMLERGLLDEVRVWLHPVLSGKAAPADLLYRDGPQRRFTISDVAVHGNGLVLLTYRPAA